MVCDSVKQTIGWLQTNTPPDLAFFDIQLGDGLSFDIFDQTNIDFPVIFATAYDPYAIKAFQVNGLDYLLKPIEQSEVERVIQKFETTKPQAGANLHEALKQIALDLKTNAYKTRFLIKVGEHLKMVDTKDISFFYSQDKSNFIRTAGNRTLPLDLSLDALEKQLDPEQFFRVSRKHIINISTISDIITHSQSRIKLKIKGMEANEEIIVSRDRVKTFKAWLES